MRRINLFCCFNKLTKQKKNLKGLPRIVRLQNDFYLNRKNYVNAILTVNILITFIHQDSREKMI